MREHEVWLLWANYDLKAAKTLLNSSESLIPPIIFHAQQCSEKSLKSYLLFRGHPIIKTHDLTRLLEICQQFDHEFNCLLPYVIDLNPHITLSRYPDTALPIPDLGPATELVKKSEKIFIFVQSAVSDKKR